MAVMAEHLAFSQFCDTPGVLRGHAPEAADMKLFFGGVDVVNLETLRGTTLAAGAIGINPLTAPGACPLRLVFS